jgi:Domain of unknown function (DUF4167)
MIALRALRRVQITSLLYRYLQETTLSIERRRQPQRKPSGRSPQQTAKSGQRDRDNTVVGWKRRLEHYLAQAQTATASGDTIGAENYYQHAEHYLRMIRSAAA